jgi:AcrR family transcriptional regulator
VARTTLTREQIVSTAIELLDVEGLEGLNMRALGKRLGAAATAVYWHGGSKDNLIVLAGDKVWDEIELPDVREVDWRTAATRMATDLYEMLGRHPWLVQAFGSHLFFGAGKARHDDHILGVYEAAGFSGAEADRASALAFTFVLGLALGQASAASLHRKLSRESGDADREIAETMAKAREIGMRFPRLRERMESVAADNWAAPERTLELGLEAILTGLEAQLDKSSRTSYPESA